MLFVNISREKVVFAGEGFSVFLVYENIERTLGPTLQDILQKYSLTRVWVLNGPGGFTFLRLGTLVINMISSLSGKPLEIYEGDKCSLYQYAREKELLPDAGVIFMGQRKKMWGYQKMKKIRSEDKKILPEIKSRRDMLLACPGRSVEVLDPENIEQFVNEYDAYFIDPCEHMLLDYLDKNNMLEMYFDGKQLKLAYKENALGIRVEDLGLKPIETLVPGYEISGCSSDG